MFEPSHKTYGGAYLDTAIAAASPLVAAGTGFYSWITGDSATDAATELIQSSYEEVTASEEPAPAPALDPPPAAPDAAPDGGPTLPDWALPVGAGLVVSALLVGVVLLYEFDEPTWGGPSYPGPLRTRT
jgi:hypothetical protein